MITRITAENYLSFVFIMGAIHNSPSSVFQGKGIDAWTCNNCTKTKNRNVNQSCLFYFLTASCTYSILYIYHYLNSFTIVPKSFNIFKKLFSMSIFSTPPALQHCWQFLEYVILFHTSKSVYILFCLPRIFITALPLPTSFFFFVLSYPYLFLNMHSNYINLLKISLFFEADLKVSFLKSSFPFLRDTNDRM